MNEEKFQELYKNTKKEEIIKELYFKCKANYELENIIKEVRETLNNKRDIFTTLLLNGSYRNYEELLYQVDEEIRKILDKENKDIELDMLKALNTDLDDDVEMG